MKKLTKIGVSALAGSLAAVSAAQAGELSVSGSAVLTYTNEDVLNQHTGNTLGMKNNMSFTGSGDVNGYEVTYFNTLSDTGTVSSSSLTVDMGDMGALTFDQGVGGNGLDAFDDMLPTAYEETNDGMTGQLDLAGDGSTNVIKYTNTVAGMSVNVAYDPATGDADTADGSFSTGASGITGSATSISLGLPTMVDGLSAGVAYGEDALAGATTTTDVTSVIGYAKYAAGPVTVGYQMAETSGGTAGSAMKAISGYGIALNVNENLSISYASLEQEYKGATSTANVTEESTGIAASYTMGSATIVVQQNEQDNAGGSTATTADEERTEIALTLAF